MGFGLVILFLQLWHLAFPVDYRALVVLAGLAAAGFWSSRKSLRAWFDISPWFARIWLLIVLGGVAVWGANWAMGGFLSFDRGQYHIQAVRWNREYAIVPGLGNLHGRLAFNNAGLLYDALLSVGPWSAGAYRIANQSLYVLALGYVIVSVFRLGTGSAHERIASLFDAVLLIPLVWIIPWPLAGCYTTDQTT